MVAANKRDALQNLSISEDETVGSGYFNAEYSADGSAPATHYLSTGAFDNRVLEAITASKLFDQIRFGMDAHTFDLLPVAPAEVQPE
jgi:hypothetical protein